MADLDDIYNSKILELSAGMPRTGHLTAPDARALAHSKLCGSTVEVEITVREGRFTDFAQNVKACLLGQAAASVVGREIVGTTIDEFSEVARTMRRMLKENGPPPAGRWADLGILEPVRDYRHRHTSTLLVFDAVEKALAAMNAGTGSGLSQAAVPVADA